MSGRDDNSGQVILATAGYDHAIRFWQAHNGVCHRTVQHADSISFLQCQLLNKRTNTIK